MWICHGDSPDLSGTKPVFFKRVSLRFCDNQFPVFLHTSFHILYFVTDWCEPGYRKTVRRETPGTNLCHHRRCRQGCFPGHDRKSVGEGQSVSGRGALGGRSNIKKKMIKTES